MAGKGRSPLRRRPENTVPCQREDVDPRLTRIVRVRFVNLLPGRPVFAPRGGRRVYAKACVLLLFTSLLAIAVVVGSSEAPPSFSMTPVNPAAAQAVQFTDSSTGFLRWMV